LSRTPASAGNRKTWTWSGWVKRTKLASKGTLFTCRNGISPDSVTLYFQFDSDDTFYLATNFTPKPSIRTTQLFRDPSSWYHVVVSTDTTQATASNRIRIYINGTQVTSFSTSTYPDQNADLGINQTAEHQIGSYFGPSELLDGYLTEIIFIDGQALTPSSFGETDAITGRWKAKSYGGTYGTNGFYLNFSDNSSLTTTSNVGIGKDFSGNTNYWATNGISITAGAGNDSLVDSPTNYGGGTGTVGNFCTWNPLINGDSAANGNLDVTNDTARGNHELMKYDAYWEVTSTGGTCLAGIISTAATSTITVGSAKTFGFKLSEAGVFEYANITDGSSFTSQATAITPPFPYASTGASITASINCGQRAFAGTLPTGYKPICTTSLDQPTIQKPSTAMDVVTYTGTGASQSISSLGFSPDLVWIKGRSGATDHALYDTTRGATFDLVANSTAAQTTQAQGLTAFGSNGFTVGTLAKLNTNTSTYVAWAWDETALDGFDIVSYAGNSSTQNISHGLGVSPSMIIVKTYSPSVDSGEGNWCVYHKSLGANKFVYLDLTNAAVTSTTIWNNTSPTASVFSLGNDNNVNKTGKTQIAYCFAEIEGFSRFGSYTGNGSSDGPFVWCGFRPRWVMQKRTDSSDNWNIFDTSRSSFNVTKANLEADTSDAESTANDFMDILSNGFKLKANLTSSNASGGTYIFAAFAESPFKYARAR
jgi:hypothetical protein